MANSSDWIAALERGGDGGLQTWLEHLPVPSTFVEGSPFLPRAAARIEPVAQLEPKPDPIAEAFARGEAAGREAAAQELVDSSETCQALRINLRRFDQAALDSLAGELAETVLNLCSQALEGFAQDPEALLARCTEAAQRLGGAPDQCALYLHPEDIALIDPTALEGWRTVPDESIARGGLRLEGPDGFVSDGPAQWRRAIESAIRG